MLQGLSKKLNMKSLILLDAWYIHLWGIDYLMSRWGFLDTWIWNRHWENSSTHWGNSSTHWGFFFFLKKRYSLPKFFLEKRLDKLSLFYGRARNECKMTEIMFFFVLWWDHSGYSNSSRCLMICRKIFKEWGMTPNH